MKTLTKLTLVTCFAVMASACDMWNHDLRDVVYNDSLCQPGLSGTCP